MNLHALVSPQVGSVNPQVICGLQMSAGYTINAAGIQVPQYAAAIAIPVQIQALSYTDIMRMGGLNIQGTRRAAYLNGNWEGVDRNAIKGGDLLTMPDTAGFSGPTTWLVAQVLEHWPQWTKLAITLQNGN